MSETIFTEEQRVEWQEMLETLKKKHPVATALLLNTYAGWCQEERAIVLAPTDYPVFKDKAACIYSALQEALPDAVISVSKNIEAHERVSLRDMAERAIGMDPDGELPKLLSVFAEAGLQLTEIFSRRHEIDEDDTQVEFSGYMTDSDEHDEDEEEPAPVRMHMPMP